MQEIMFTGNLTKDPTMRVTKSGKYVCSFTVAVNRSRRDANGNDITDFFEVTTWNRFAEICNTSLHKGARVFVRGELQVERYESNNGPNFVLKVNSSSTEFLTPKREEPTFGEPEPIDMGDATPFMMNEDIFPPELR